MAGRPIDPMFRAQRLTELDSVILQLQQENKPVTRKNIAEHMGLSVQALYGSGFLSERIKMLEATGVISSGKSAPAQITESELKKLRKNNARLQTEVERLQKRNAELSESLKKKNLEINCLTESLFTVRGELFSMQKLEFAQNRI